MGCFAVGRVPEGAVKMAVISPEVGLAVRMELER